MSYRWLNDNIAQFFGIVGWAIRAGQHVSAVADTLFYYAGRAYERRLPQTGAQNEDDLALSRFKDNLQKCLLLRLPMELHLEIAERLPRDSVVALAQTSKIFRGRLRYCGGRLADMADPMQMEHRERVRFVIALGRGQLDTWGCPRCKRMHSVKAEDVPYALTNLDCPYLFSNGSGNSNALPPQLRNLHHHAIYNLQDNIATPSYNLEHHHIQLALKYCRLLDLQGELLDDPRKKNEALRLQKQLEPRSPKKAEFTAFHYNYLARLLKSVERIHHFGDYVDGVFYGVKSCVGPRIARQRDGTYRFLLITSYPSTCHFSDRRWTASGRRLSPISISLCPHQRLDFDRHGIALPSCLRDPRYRQNWVEEGSKPCFAPCYRQRMLRFPRRGSILEAYQFGPEQGMEIVTSCPYCPTDIVFYIDQWFVFQDYGNEYTCPFGLEPLVRLPNLLNQTLPRYERKAGSVYKMFQSALANKTMVSPLMQPA
ncbi:hypothetical protein SCUCBS95973_000634 [Sporothrix curviconia]|uniref:F-box domain-containing protein n=1 Tax=Sporothrix curviconia TaxID=1260050 RepID=A0ABP0ARU5_9PEZI